MNRQNNDLKQAELDRAVEKRYKKKDKRKKRKMKVSGAGVKNLARILKK